MRFSPRAIGLSLALYDPAMNRDVTAFVLAGGKSTRMGTDKAFVMLDGRTLLDRALEAARSVTENVFVSGDPAKYESYAACVTDFYPNCGPLAGIHAALHSSYTEFNLILAVDLPFVTAGFLQFLISRAMASTGANITLPRSDGQFQPLCTVYRREFVVSAEQALRAGRYRIDALFDPRVTQVIEQDVLEAAGFSSNIFRNLNSPEAVGESGYIGEANPGRDR